jgi:hypothetical protein
MSSTPKSTNHQYGKAGGSYFPNKSKRYARLNITNSKARRDQKRSRRVEALTTDKTRFNKLLNTGPPKKRKLYKRLVDNILAHNWDQSILATEHGQFPSLPKASVVDTWFPVQVNGKKRRKDNMAAARLSEPLLNAFIPSNFQQLTDVSLSTGALVISGREQPLGGSESSPEALKLPNFVPNAAYGGTQVPYR